jgi:5-methyltetrahydropteroyltriglutamate--homocysteine methyltransferase
MEDLGECQAAEGQGTDPRCDQPFDVLVEHPELVAERIVKYASLVGRERVIAGSDCGFATFAGSKEVHPSIVWAKIQSMTEGARMASKALWKKTGKAKAAKKAVKRKTARAKK